MLKELILKLEHEGQIDMECIDANSCEICQHETLLKDHHLKHIYRANTETTKEIYEDEEGNYYVYLCSYCSEPNGAGNYNIESEYLYLVEERSSING